MNSTSTIRRVRGEIKRTKVCMPRHLATFSEFTLHFLTLNINETFKKCVAQKTVPNSFSSATFIFNLIFLLCALSISISERHCQLFNLQVLDVSVSKDLSWLSKDRKRHIAIHLYPHTHKHMHMNTHVELGVALVLASNDKKHTDTMVIIPLG